MSLPPVGRLPFPPALAPLAAVPQWVLWSWVQLPSGNWDKIPTGLGGGPISTRNPVNLRTLADATARIDWSIHAGVGFVPDEALPWLFLDLDDCRDPATGEILEEAAAVVEACGSYCEATPSGTGLRVVGLADGWDAAEMGGKRRFRLADGRLKGEVYRSKNYVTVTFRAIGGTESAMAPIGAVAAALAADADNEVGSGAARRDDDPDRDRTAPAEVVRELLAAIPNEGRADWSWWVEGVGLAAWGATGGSAEGLEAWEEWSRRCPDYGVGETCEQRWEKIGSSPPDRIGWGRLWWLGRQAAGGEGRGWTPGPATARWLAAKGGLGPIPPEARAWPAAREGGNKGVAGEGTGGEREAEPGEPPPTIVLRPPIHEAADAAEAALTRAGAPVYLRERLVVTPAFRETRTCDGGRALAASFAQVAPMALVDMMSKSASFARWDARKEELVRADPPEKLAAIVLDRAGRRPFREASGIATAPTLRPDGSVLWREGWDEATRLVMVPDPSLRMPEGWLDRDPTRREAEDALDLLDGLLDAFPFADRPPGRDGEGRGRGGWSRDSLDRSVALSMLLTPVARGACIAVPLHGIRATAAGSGKSFLADVASAILTGCPCPAAAVDERADETDKRLGAMLMAGFPLISLDNINGAFRSDLCCQAAERPTVRVRVLGLSKTVEVENRSTIFLNGNNMRASGDLVRRTLTCILDPRVERPEARRFPFDPAERASRDRGRYVAAALAVPRAFLAAGCPGMGTLEPLASYPEWSRLVRGALAWLGRRDPAESVSRAREEDPDILLLREVLGAWSRAFGLGTERTSREAAEAALGMAAGGMAAVGGDAASRAARGAASGDLRDVLLRVAGERGGSAVNTRRLGNWLANHEGRIVGGMRFARRPGRDHVVAWSVEAPHLTVVGGTGESEKAAAD